MNDPTLTLAFILSCGLNVMLYVRWQRAEKRRPLTPSEIELAAQLKSAREAKAVAVTVAAALSGELKDTQERLADTEAALHAKVAAETRGGDGPVAA